MPLSDVAIRNLKPAEKTYKVSDSGGLYIEVAPSGGKWWRLKYRFGGKEKRISLGVYPDVGLKDARDRRDAARKLLADNIDPGERRKQEKEAIAVKALNSFEAVTRDWFSKRVHFWAKSHADKIIRRFERDVFPWIGKRPIADITARELLKAIHHIEERGARETAHRALENCGQVFRYAEAHGLISYDPSRALHGALEPVKGRHFAAITTPVGVAKLLRSFDDFKGSYVVLAALKLSPLFFVRPGELRMARWEDIDFDKAQWSYWVTKTDFPHLVPLATQAQAQAILRELYQITGNSEYIFAGRTPNRPMSENTVNAALRRLGYDTQKDMTGHGFRAMARTMLHEELDFAPEVIEHQLAHQVSDPLGTAYNRTKFLEQRKAMMQEWANYLDFLKANFRTAAPEMDSSSGDSC